MEEEKVGDVVRAGGQPAMVQAQGSEGRRGIKLVAYDLTSVCSWLMFNSHHAPTNTVLQHIFEVVASFYKSRFL